MGTSRVDRMTGSITIARDTVRVIDGPETHATSIRFERGGKFRAPTSPLLRS